MRAMELSERLDDLTRPNMDAEVVDSSHNSHPITDVRVVTKAGKPIIQIVVEK